MESKRRHGNVYTGNPIDRLGDRRHDEAFITGLLARDDAVLLAMQAGRHLVLRGEMGTAIAQLRPSEAPALAAARETHPTVLLGLLDDGTPAIAIDLGDDDTAPPPLAGAEFVDLLRVAPEMAAADAALLAQARGFLHWRRTHRFCGRCGQACAPIEGGYVVECTGCGTRHFPRTDPAVIMLVTRGGSRGAPDGERALLARNARFGKRRVFSTLAGFVEPGESLEETVVRESREECGVHCHNVRYHSSQPWPFPASVMLGFTAETDDAAPVIDGIEIIEAAFFSRAEIRDHAAHGFELPPHTSIARRLVDDWCAQGEP